MIDDYLMMKAYLVSPPVSVVSDFTKCGVVRSFSEVDVGRFFGSVMGDASAFCTVLASRLVFPNLEFADFVRRWTNDSKSVDDIALLKSWLYDFKSVNSAVVDSAIRRIGSDIRMYRLARTNVLPEHLIPAEECSKAIFYANNRGGDARFISERDTRFISLSYAANSFVYSSGGNPVDNPELRELFFGIWRREVERVLAFNNVLEVVLQ